MTAAPTITTERLTLRATRFEDFEAYAAFHASDRAKYVNILDRWAAWHAFAFEAAGWTLFGYGCWSIEHRQKKTLVGQVGIIRHAPELEPELGWHLYEGFEGKGLAFESSEAARDWVFDNTTETTLVSFIDPENARSIKLAERLGARLDPDAKSDDEDDLVYRHTKPEYQI